MSLIWMDGFEDTSLWSRKYNWTGSSVTTVTGRTGNAIALNGGTSPAKLLRSLGSNAHATIVTGFAFKSETNHFPTGTSSYFHALFGDTGSTQHIALTFDSSTEPAGMVVWAGGTNQGTFSTFSQQTWYYLEMKAVIHDSTGSVVIKVNGTTTVNLTNIDTKNAGTGSVIDVVGFGARANSGAGDMIFDDLYILNGAGAAYNDFLGDVTVETIRPNGNGNSSQFTGSDGNSTDNYLLVDEATYDSTDYVQSATTNNKDLYTYADLVAASGSVKGVMATGVMQKTASGAQSARQLTRIGGTNYNGASQSLTTTDSAYTDIWEVSPATASNWTISEVNGAEFGVEVL